MNYAQLGNMLVCNGADCNFGHLIDLAKVVMNNIVVVATLLVTIAFVVIGIKFLTSGGDIKAREDSKKIAKNVLLGFFFVLAGWLIVYTITSVLLRDGFSFIKEIR